MSYTFMKNPVEMLGYQTQDAYKWAYKVASATPREVWENIPVGIESSISWQVGHLIMSIYYHSIIVVKGHQQDILSRIPMKEYDGYFTQGLASKSIGKVDPDQLLEYLKFIGDRSVEIILSLDEASLVSPLEPFRVAHPVAKNKFEALDWNIKHTMWHCGQMGMVKRAVDKKFDFGIRF